MQVHPACDIDQASLGVVKKVGPRSCGHGLCVELLLRCLWTFVEDYASYYLVRVDGRIHKACILPYPMGSFDVGTALEHSDSRNDDLRGFAKRWTEHSNWSPEFETDDVPFTEVQLAALTQDVQAHFPAGKLLERKCLFDLN